MRQTFNLLFQNFRIKLRRVCKLYTVWVRVDSSICAVFVLRVVRVRLRNMELQNLQKVLRTETYVNLGVAFVILAHTWRLLD